MKHLSKTKYFLLFIITFFPLSSFSGELKSAYKHSQTVSVSAYNSLASQTKKGDPALAAWGDALKPGMKVIAVSRDLLKKGLTHNKEVKIEGLKGTYRVMDKMNKRWKNKIDVYMGVDVKAARKWGKQTRKIYWN